MSAPDLRRCSRCQELQPRSQFYPCGHSWCRGCHRHRAEERRLALPPSGERLPYTRKARICKAVSKGEISVEAAAERWSLDPSELEAWLRRYAEHGADGLKLKNVSALRQARAPGCPP